MLYNLYVIYDEIAKESGFPFDAKNDDVANRKFQSYLKQITSTPNSVVSETEFTLLCIGEYDSETCSLTTNNPHEVDMLSTEKKED